MKKHFMICIDNRGYEASLETRKIYEVLADREAERYHPHLSFPRSFERESRGKGNG